MAREIAQSVELNALLKKLSPDETARPFSSDPVEFEAKEVKEEDRTILFTASDETQDRDGDILSVDGWDLKNYRNNPVILYGHSYRDLPIGTGVPVKADGKLKMKVKFATPEVYPFADTVFRLAQAGILKATSVGFIPRKWEDMYDDVKSSDGEVVSRKFKGRKYLKQELLELSIVAVPSNPNALRNSFIKGIVKPEDGELMVKNNLIGKAEMDTLIKEAEKIMADEIEAKLWEDQEEWTEIRYRVRNPNLFVDGSFRRKKMEGVNIIMIVGRLKTDPDGSAVLQSLRFPKPEWTLAKAKEWVEAHKDELGKALEPDTIKDAGICDNDGNIIIITPKAVTLEDTAKAIENLGVKIELLTAQLKELQDALAKYLIKPQEDTSVASGDKPKEDDKGKSHLGAILDNSERALKRVQEMSKR